MPTRTCVTAGLKSGAAVEMAGRKSCATSVLAGTANDVVTVNARTRALVATLIRSGQAARFDIVADSQQARDRPIVIVHERKENDLAKRSSAHVKIADHYDSTGTSRPRCRRYTRLPRWGWGRCGFASPPTAPGVPLALSIVRLRSPGTLASRDHPSSGEFRGDLARFVRGRPEGGELRRGSPTFLRGHSRASELRRTSPSNRPRRVLPCRWSASPLEQRCTCATGGQPCSRRTLL